MFMWLYRQPIIYVVLFIYLLIALWTLGINFFSNKEKTRRFWTYANILLLGTSIFFILYATLFTRIEDTVRVLHLQPFRLFKIAKSYPEMYRSMIMNVALFVPLGISVSSLFRLKNAVTKVFIFAALTGLFCSTLIELTQYAFALGETELDDVICNTFGTFIGSFPSLLQWLYTENKKQEN